MGTPIDTAREAQENSGQVPSGPAPTGSVLKVTGQLPFKYGWSQVAEAWPVLQWHGNPDGDLVGRLGQLCTDIDTPDVYQNQDGATAWELVGGSAGGGFPLTEDDGTTTHSITTVAHQMAAKTVLDADSGVYAEDLFIAGTSGASKVDAAFAAGGYSAFTLNAYTSGRSVAILTQDSVAVRLFVNNGNPNGSLSGGTGDVCFDVATPAIWISTGGTTWVAP